MSIQLQGNSDSVFSNDVVAPNLPTQGQIVGYQQGIWTPVSKVGASSLKGRWTRVGDFITLHFVVEYESTTGGTTEEISGFPYVGLSTGDEKTDRGTGFCAYTTFSGGAGCLMKASSLDAWTFRSLPTGENLSFSQCSGKAFRGTFFFTTDDTTWTPINGATLS
jgi:hypothetical protein